MMLEDVVMPARAAVSVLVLTRNEEANIAECLESLRWAAEVLVVDSMSTDRTVEIAEALGANGAVVTYRVYFGCTEFTASDIATCTIAMERDQGLPTVPAAFSASIVW